MTVKFAGQKSTASAGGDGKWTADLKDLKASFEPAAMVIREQGGKTETLIKISETDNPPSFDLAMEVGLSGRGVAGVETSFSSGAVGAATGRRDGGEGMVRQVPLV